ncbi:MAG: Phosphate metabolism transcription protein [Geoglossum umbratile]|nr:MAG: Phosphate metabolism transcription protein [Geoglossum umbratile]
MRFGRTLHGSIYPPWERHYIDYPKLKLLLKESDKSSDNDETDEWTDADEGAFVEELVNVQLEKVHSFQVDMYKQLRERTSNCESKLEGLVASADKGKDKSAGPGLAEKDIQDQLKGVLRYLDGITREINELEKFSRINFTGFLKAAKKHDRKRGSKYRVRPLLQVRLGALPFNSEDYSPLLYRLSAMYSFVRQNMDKESNDPPQSFSDAQPGGEKYVSYKFWVHSDNLLEVKTYILRRLPVLVYNPQTSKVAEGIQNDPTITSLYFDNPKFSLYTQKVDRKPDASSLRLRWYGQLAKMPEILFEKKTMREGDNSEEMRFPAKEKYVQSFIKGEYKMEKTVQKIQHRQGNGSQHAERFVQNVDAIQEFIKENHLQPVLRANYTRTAFQIPGDGRIRVSLDTNLALIREDSFDSERPCRDPDSWHRTDIDDAEMEYPFHRIRKGEISRFPHAILEIKVREGTSEKSKEWVTDLTDSHLVKEAPRFSKFVHGVAVLFEDYVNSFPFWLSELENDIRKDPETAFEAEQERKAKKAEDEFAVGSLVGSRASPAFKPATGSPITKARIEEMRGPRSGVGIAAKQPPAVDDEGAEGEADSDDDGDLAGRPSVDTPAGLRSLFPTFSKYSRAHQGLVPLPPGVRHPGKFIKDSGPVQVEAKVWLANQRTFIKWQHISVLLASLSLGLYNAAGEANNIARGLAVVYTLIALFAGGWGWWMYISRSRLIQERSGKDFDNVLGPAVVCVGLIIALCLNFGFKVRERRIAMIGKILILCSQYHAAIARQDSEVASNQTTGIEGDMFQLAQPSLKLIKQGP